MRRDIYSDDRKFYEKHKKLKFFWVNAIKIVNILLITAIIGKKIEGEY